MMATVLQQTVLVLLSTAVLFAQKPQLLLLNNYKTSHDVVGWYMSEKLDGVRAFWDGKKLISRSGRVFAAPSFFTKDFPTTRLDGELWTKRADFSHIVSIVNRKKPHSGWKNITYRIFEVPSADGNLTSRLSKVKETTYIKLIKQIEIKSTKELTVFLKNIEKKGGEGVVVRDASLHYYAGRTDKSLKVKSYKDEECKVVGYNKGKGKYSKLIGSIKCKLGNSRVINIGSGLTDKLRASPPKMGEFITFKYYGLTSKGKPRFPVFLRVYK